MELWKNETLEKWSFRKTEILKMEIRKNGDQKLGKMVFRENGCWEKWKLGRTEI